MHLFLHLIFLKLRCRVYFIVPDHLIGRVYFSFPEIYKVIVHLTINSTLDPIMQMLNTMRNHSPWKHQMRGYYYLLFPGDKKGWSVAGVCPKMWLTTPCFPSTSIAHTPLFMAAWLTQHTGGEVWAWDSGWTGTVARKCHGCQEGFVLWWHLCPTDRHTAPVAPVLEQVPCAAHKFSNFRLILMNSCPRTLWFWIYISWDWSR